MTTIGYMAWNTWGVNVTQANRTIRSGYIFNALQKTVENYIEVNIAQSLLEIFTLCPSVFSCTGKHMLHTSQWKKLARPPKRQMPQPWQWYWSLSSSSNRLHIKQVYCKWNNCTKKKNDKKLFSFHLSESYAAIFTIGLDFLSGVTLCANQFSQRLTIEMMSLVFIMAITALVELTTAWGLCENTENFKISDLRSLKLTFKQT